MTGAVTVLTGDFNKLAETVGDIGHRVGRIESDLKDVQDELSGQDQRVTAVESKQTELGKRMDSMDQAQHDGSGIGWIGHT